MRAARGLRARWGTEQRHDAVARVLVNRTLVAVHTVRKNRKETIEDLMPRLGVELPGKLHGTLYVGEHHRHLLALAFERGTRRQYFLGEMFRCIGLRRSFGNHARSRVATQFESGANDAAALIAEFRIFDELCVAGGTTQR